MGIRQIFIVILVFILLASTVSAVSFEWVMGNSATADSLSSGRHEDNEDACFKWNAPDLIRQQGRPVLMLTGFINDAHTCANRCNTGVRYTFFYKGREFFSEKYFARRSSSPDYEPQIYSPVDNAVIGGSCDWQGEGGYKSCDAGDHCDFDGELNIYWAEIDVSGFASVFPKDNIVSLGRIKDLYPKDLLPDNDTIYLGLYTANHGDIMYWFGELEEDPTIPLKRETDDYYEYINVCSDLNHNGICDYTDAEKCYDNGADWYGDPDSQTGFCCGPDPAQINQDTGMESTDCAVTLYADKAYCGTTLSNNYEWAPKNEIGAVHELLNCPGASMVSDGQQFQLCEPGDDTEFFTITPPALGTHGYLCYDGEIFECAGDNTAYSSNQDFVAETGTSTNDLVGSGGCPPKIVAYWSLENNANDIEGSYNGAIEGATSTAGKIDNAMHFEVGHKITFPASLPITGDQFTVEAWIKPTQTSGVRKIIEKENSFKIAIDSELLVGAVQTDTPMIDFGSRRVVSNAWHHVALAYNGEKALLYLDGVAVTDDDVSGDIVWSNKPIILGGSFIGDIDEVAIYDKALRSSLIKRHSQLPARYCHSDGGPTTKNYYCAADGEWITDLDIKDASSCNKAGFVWTGNLCCSEDDDAMEYYNDHDTPAADLLLKPAGQTVAAHASAQVESSQIILKNIKQYATIQGPAKLQIETYSAESPTDLGSCPELPGSPQIIDVAPWENRTIRINSLGKAGSTCRYRWKIITAKPLLALGGCWNKKFVPIGHFASPGIINYHGAFYSCGLSANALPMSLKDFHTNMSLIIPASPDCDNIMLNARGSGIHAVCNPGYKWQFTNNSAANTPARTKWNVTSANASQWGCCTENQCWTGKDCSNIGEFYKVDSMSYYCGE